MATETKAATQSVTVNTKQLTAALKLCKGTIFRHGLPILANVLIVSDGRGVVLYATDLDTWTSVCVGEPGDGYFTTTADAVQLLAIVQAARGAAVRLTYEGDDTSAAQYLYINDSRLATLPAAEFPTMPSPELMPFGAPSGAAFCGGLVAALAAASKDAASPVLWGVNLSRTIRDEIVIAATDRHRLHVATVAASGISEVQDGGILAQRTAKLVGTAFKDAPSLGIRSNGTTSARTTIRYIEFTAVNNPVRILVRAIEGNYPNVQSVIPVEFTQRAVVNSVELLSVLAQAKPFAKDGCNPLRLTVTSDSVAIVASTAMVGEFSGKVDAAVKDTEIVSPVFGVNLTYLVDAIKTMGAARVALCFNGATQPALIRAEPDNGRLAVVMPVRIP